MSHCSSIRYINLLGENYDKRVIEWLQQDQGSIKVAGDNIDINQSAQDQRKDNPGKNHHWFLAMAFKTLFHPLICLMRTPFATSKICPCLNSS